MAQPTIGQRRCDMFANTRGDKCANRWGVFDSCGTDQHLSDITSELTGRGDYIQPSIQTIKLKNTLSVPVQRFVRRAVTKINSTCPSLFAFAATEPDHGVLLH